MSLFGVDARRQKDWPLGVNDNRDYMSSLLAVKRKSIFHGVKVTSDAGLLAYNIGNFLRCLALPKSISDWSLRTMREKLVKIGAKVVSHARYVTFQMAEVLVSKSLFREILERIHRLKPVPIGSG